jgi:CHAT domain-containing protein
MMFQMLTSLLTDAKVRVRDTRMTGWLHSGAGGGTEFKAILRVLWQDVVKPVIERLAFPVCLLVLPLFTADCFLRQSELNRPPRIWWCATGLLAFLPIHAAGLYDTEEIGEKVSDYVISSYTPTLTAILELSDPIVREDFQVLTIAQSSAPGAQPIPKTEDEVNIVQRLNISARALNLTGDQATVERVREGMMESNWIHLACHGQQDPTDPMESGFLLHDEILKLSEIVRMALPKADFAFLSACQTAMGDEKLAEESVHLAAGMLLSGCRGVIATMWSIRDEDGPTMAEEVYSRMFKDGKPNRKEAAYALHEAVKALRKSGAGCVSWVPFIHIGR